MPAASTRPELWGSHKEEHRNATGLPNWWWVSQNKYSLGKGVGPKVAERLHGRESAHRAEAGSHKDDRPIGEGVGFIATRSRDGADGIPRDGVTRGAEMAKQADSGTGK